MSFSKEVRTECLSCGNTGNLRTYGILNVKEDPSIKERVKNGSLFVWECPHCGHLNLIKYQTLYHDPDAGLMIWLLPEGVVSEAEMQVIEGQMSAVTEQIDKGSELERYTLRRVSDVGSLIEKVNIFDAGLDDATMEMCKYITKLELKEKSKDLTEDTLDAPFKFYRMEGADNEIVFSFPKDGNMHGVKTGFNVYEDCAAILRRNPDMKPEKGFAKVDAEWLAKRIR